MATAPAAMTTSTLPGSEYWDKLNGLMSCIYSKCDREDRDVRRDSTPEENGFDCDPNSLRDDR